MSERVNFHYESIGNIVKLLVTILFEKTTYLDEYSDTWREVFDGTAGDKLFEAFLHELFPEGANLSETHLTSLLEHAMKYIKTNKECQDIHNKNLMRRYSSFVYSKYNNKVYRCGYLQHADTVQMICLHFFDGMKDVTFEQVYAFLKNNFYIASNNTTVMNIVNDADHIYREIIMHNNRIKEN